MESSAWIYTWITTSPALYVWDWGSLYLCLAQTHMYGPNIHKKMQNFEKRKAVPFACLYPLAFLKPMKLVGDYINETIRLIYSFLKKRCSCHWHCWLRTISALVWDCCPRLNSEPGPFSVRTEPSDPSLQRQSLVLTVCKLCVHFSLLSDSKLWAQALMFSCLCSLLLKCILGIVAQQTDQGR